MTVQQIIIDTSALQLPREFAEKIGTKRVLIQEVHDGLLLTPVPQKPGKLSGALKGTGFSTTRDFEQKRTDKELEG